MRVLITGSDGQLGRALVMTAPSHVTVTALDRAALDITAPEAARAAIARYSPDLIVNAAAYTQVDQAESERDRAYKVNAEGPANLAQFACTTGARLIHISTDYVFNGNASRPYRASDATEPLSVYGSSKLEGEKWVMSNYPGRVLILRSGWIYSASGQNFVTTMLRLMREREEVRVVTDQIGTPTWAKTFAHVIWLAAERSALSGIYHWSDAGQASWYDFAMAIQEEALELKLLKRAILIKPIGTAEYPMAARRPAYAVLDTTATIADFGVESIHWRNALHEMLAELVHA
jgi:dTDP-4-dehydrorhamnose reductase